MDEKLRIVRPYGHIYVNGQDYFLLKPEPIIGDSWERDGTYRFLVVPNESMAYEQRGSKFYMIFGYARHIVTNSFTIEFMHDITDIAIPILDEIDVTETRIEDKENAEKDEFPF